MPLAILARDYHTTPDKFFKKYFFVGDHDQVASAVYHRCVDGGATWDNSYKLNSQKKKFGPVFRVIKKTPPIPNDAWVAGPGVDDELAARMRKLLIGITTKTRTRGGDPVIDLEAGFPGTGWKSRGPEFYENAARYLLYEPKK
jgi:ABC-type phosphate/phosphonate transport system substrate-binding protein